MPCRISRRNRVVERPRDDVVMLVNDHATNRHLIGSKSQIALYQRLVHKVNVTSLDGRHSPTTVKSMGAQAALTMANKNGPIENSGQTPFKVEIANDKKSLGCQWYR
uniref:Uncharacterized protein n=1 Tax=Spongospora subterranea TaxID=70186 RepID=A0A0H5QQX9_9EUKA|eukprot:CRZ04037.1 hypothetical protein [Spongospora subterranea]